MISSLPTPPYDHMVDEGWDQISSAHIFGISSPASFSVRSAHISDLTSEVQGPLSQILQLTAGGQRSLSFLHCRRVCVTPSGPAHHAYANSVSSIVLPRGEAGPTFLTAAASNGEGQLPYFSQEGRGNLSPPTWRLFLKIWECCSMYVPRFVNIQSCHEVLILSVYCLHIHNSEAALILLFYIYSYICR